MRGVLLRFLGLLWLVRVSKPEPNHRKKFHAVLRVFVPSLELSPCIIPNAIGSSYFMVGLLCSFAFYIFHAKLKELRIQFISSWLLNDC